MHQEAQPVTRAARVRWPLIVVGLLMTHVGAMMLAVQIASSDTGHAVLPNYYDKAIRWDDRQAEARESDRLGWSVSVTPAALTDANGDRAVRILMHDRFGAPVVDAAVSARVWHHALGDAHDLLVRPTGEPGLYVATAPMARPGSWQCELIAEHAGARFVESYALDVVSPLEAGAEGL